MNSVRLLPLVAFAALCLLLLKSAGLIFSGGYMLTGSADAQAQDTKPAAPAKGADKAAAKPAPKDGKGGGAKTKPGKRKPSGDALDKLTRLSKSELAVLQSLTGRRKQLDARARDLRLRENLLKAAEKRVESRISELKIIEAKIEKSLKKREERQTADFRRLVKTYESMKPKLAAKIFDRLDIAVLVRLMQQMKPQTMSRILAKMNAAAAERLTMEIAAKNRSDDRAPSSALPKIGETDPG